MKPRWAAAGVLACFLLATLAPLAVAENEERQRPERTALDRPDGRPGPMPDGKAFDIRFNGTATDKDNVTYTVEMRGVGYARVREANNTTDVMGIARLHARLVDADGNVVKEGDLRVRFHAHKVADADWKWKLIGFANHTRGFPQLVMRGTGAEGMPIELEGHGKAWVRFPDERYRTGLKLDVTGEVSRL